MGVAAADFDNDGNLDLFITGYGHSVLYRGLGNCKFEDVTEKAGLGGITGLATGAAWGDYDRDGHVDLFVSRYVHVDMKPSASLRQRRKNSAASRVYWLQCGPWGMPGEGDYLFHNRGDGTFEDVSKKSGDGRSTAPLWSGAQSGPTTTTTAGLNLFVANDAGPNFLYHNRHDGNLR